MVRGIIVGNVLRYALNMHLFVIIALLLFTVSCGSNGSSSNNSIGSIGGVQGTITWPKMNDNGTITYVPAKGVKIHFYNGKYPTAWTDYSTYTNSNGSFYYDEFPESGNWNYYTTYALRYRYGEVRVIENRIIDLGEIRLK